MWFHLQLHKKQQTIYVAKSAGVDPRFLKVCVWGGGSRPPRPPVGGAPGCRRAPSFLSTPHPPSRPGVIPETAAPHPPPPPSPPGPSTASRRRYPQPARADSGESGSDVRTGPADRFCTLLLIRRRRHRAVSRPGLTAGAAAAGQATRASPAWHRPR